jgi:DNA polymerase-3 subunit gamma/tau
MLAQLGSSPSELTERIRQTIDAARQKISAEDSVRMLRLLMETEAAVRRSANPRLALETLLLRWAVMDRTVDLEAVLSGAAPPAPGGSGASRGGRKPPAPPPAEPQVGGESVDQVTSGPVPRTEAGGPAAPFTTSGITALWPEVVKSGGPLLASALAACEVVSAEPPAITVRLPAEHAVLAPAIERDRAHIERVLQARLGGGPVVLRLEGPPAGSQAQRPKRLTEGALRTERLQGLRGTDPALDAAMDELDLEIVEERPPGSR